MWYNATVGGLSRRALMFSGAEQNQPAKEGDLVLQRPEQSEPGIEDLYRLYLGIEAVYTQSMQATSQQYTSATSNATI